jgi:hypothetical protein
MKPVESLCEPSRLCGGLWVPGPRIVRVFRLVRGFLGVTSGRNETANQPKYAKKRGSEQVPENTHFSWNFVGVSAYHLGYGAASLHCIAGCEEFLALALDLTPPPPRLRLRLSANRPASAVWARGPPRVLLAVRLAVLCTELESSMHQQTGMSALLLGRLSHCLLTSERVRRCPHRNRFGRRTQ